MGQKKTRVLQLQMILVYNSLSVLTVPRSICWAASFSAYVLFSLSSLQQEVLEGE